MMTSLGDVIKNQIRDSLEQFKSAAKMAAMLEAFRVVYEKVDRIISGHPVDVRMHVGSSGNSMLDNAPGWTDGQTISLNADMIDRDLGKLPMTTVVLHTAAVNYHELSHVMFSPRMRDDITKWVIDRQKQGGPEANLWWYAFNGLEDQRIETMFTAKYRPAGRYFEAIVLKWMVVNSAFVAESFLLIHGRKFLPDTIRIPARAAFVQKYGDALADEAERIIDSYLDIIYPGDTLKAQMVIRQMVQLMIQMQALHPFNQHPTPTLPTADNGGASGPLNPKYDPTVVKKGNSKTKDQAEAHKDMDQVTPRQPRDDENDVKDGFPTDDDDNEGNDDDADDGDSDGNGGDETDTAQGDKSEGDVEEVDIPGDPGEGEDDGEAESGQGKSLTGSGTPTQSDGNSESESGTDQDGEGSESNSSGEPGGAAQTGSGQTPVNQTINAVYNALDDLFEDEDFLNELQETADSIHDVLKNSEGAAWGEAAEYSVAPVSQAGVRAAKKMANMLSRLQTDLEETRVNRQSAGSFDFKRYQARQPWEFDYFKVYEPGLEEETDIELVVMLDISYSMLDEMKFASEAMWTVKRAFEDLDSRITVLGFSEKSFIMYQPYEKVDRTQMRSFNARNATDPDGALEEALRLFTLSNRTQKVLVAITDGDWQGNEVRQTALINAMHEMDVVTVLIDIDSGYGMTGLDHGMSVHHELREIDDIPKVAVGIVKEAMERLAGQMTV